MNILITGGAGFIGTVLAKQLISAGHEVVAVDPLTPQIHGALPELQLPEGLELIRADIRNSEQYRDAVEKADAIYHLAAETGTGQSMYQISQYVSCNDFGTAQLLETIASCTPRERTIFLASSRSIYGEGAYTRAGGDEAVMQAKPRSPEALAREEWELRDVDGTTLEPVATPETLPFSPGSVYAATKAAQELLLISASPGLRAKSVIFRFQNVYGEGQSLRNPYTGIISIFFNRARQGFDIPLFEDGQPTRDFVHVEDVARAMVDSLSADLAHGEVINLGSGVATTVEDLARKLTQQAGFDVPIKVTGQYRVGDIRHNWADLSRASSLLGYAPQIDLSTGLSRFVAWAAGQPAYQDRSEQANEELRAKGLAKS